MCSKRGERRKNSIVGSKSTGRATSQGKLMVGGLPLVEVSLRILPLRSSTTSMQPTARHACQASNSIVFDKCPSPVRPRAHRTVGVSVVELPIIRYVSRDEMDRPFLMPYSGVYKALIEVCLANGKSAVRLMVRSDKLHARCIVTTLDKEFDLIANIVTMVAFCICTEPAVLSS
ncbi:hypothetical protein HBI67_036860 [Parastagonospora nodorum]|nr:hypothetical protein HBI67_036860 [Parastagonospora nodorum]KAH6092214.1 hypothetical protein HBI66_006920 [Parastagonospora nodorum]